MIFDTTAFAIVGFAYYNVTLRDVLAHLPGD